MMQPGRETNLPTSSGFVGDRMNAQSTKVLGFETGRQLINIDGFALTFGMALSVIMLLLVWSMFFRKGRRR